MGSVAARKAFQGQFLIIGDDHLLLPAGPAAPLFVFIHGGYWQALSAAESLFPAPALNRRGWAFAALEYTLAPRAGVARMVEECATGLAAVVAAARPSQVVLVGHSAGAHLAAMVALVRPAPVPVGRVVLISGVFDLRRLVHTSVNRPLGLDETTAAPLSPLALPIAGSVPEVVVAWAENDTETFANQSRAYASRLGASAMQIAGRHHFDILDDMADPTTELGAAALGVRR